jgi:transposase
MAAPYSMDLRTRVLADCDKGLNPGEVAQKYTVSPAWVYRLLQRRGQTGEVRPRMGRPGPKPKLQPEHGRLRQVVAAEPGLTAGEYHERLGCACSVVTVWRALRRLGLTFKKK